MPTRITNHVLVWNHKGKKGAVGLVLEGGQKASFDPVSAEEFLALATILNESPVYLLENGAIQTELEQVGGA